MLALVIPYYNEGPRLATFLQRLDRAWPELRTQVGERAQAAHCVVVDDGSNPSELAALRNLGFSVLRHPVNLGQGAALQTGIQYARDRLRADLFATLDSDGQHRPEDLPGLVKVLEKDQADIVFGSRFVDHAAAQEIPSSRRFLLPGEIRFERALPGLR